MRRFNMNMCCLLAVLVMLTVAICAESSQSAGPGAGQPPPNMARKPAAQDNLGKQQNRPQQKQDSQADEQGEVQNGQTGQQGESQNGQAGEQGGQ